MCDEATRTAEAHDIRVRLIVSVNRHESVEIADQVLDAALATQDCALVAMDLAGQEVGYSARPFKDLFDRAEAEGLHLTVHAGRMAGRGKRARSD